MQLGITRLLMGASVSLVEQQYIYLTKYYSLRKRSSWALVSTYADVSSTSELILSFRLRAKHLSGTDCGMDWSS